MIFFRYFEISFFFWKGEREDDRLKGREDFLDDGIITFYRCFCLLEQMKFYENLFKIGKEDDLNFMILSKRD